MSKKFNLSPVAAAVGVALTTGLCTIPAANAEQNPFALTELSSGYMVADNHEGKCGEGKTEEGKCGEGKCGEGKTEEGKCGEKMQQEEATDESAS